MHTSTNQANTVDTETVFFQVFFFWKCCVGKCKIHLSTQRLHLFWWIHSHKSWLLHFHFFLSWRLLTFPLDSMCFLCELYWKITIFPPLPPTWKFGFSNKLAEAFVQLGFLSLSLLLSTGIWHRLSSWSNFGQNEAYTFCIHVLFCHLNSEWSFLVHAICFSTLRRVLEVYCRPNSNHV